MIIVDSPLQFQGWGCGYRSLQTLCSWAVKYNQRHPRPSPPSESPHRERCATVPSIPKIQSCLVDVGDKPPSFAGSKEWIGCYEASIVLDHLYEVTVKKSSHKGRAVVYGTVDQLGAM